MLVTAVKISDAQYCGATARHQAAVCLMSRNQVVTLACQAQGAAERTPVAGLIGDAIRQLRRMPEYRTGRTPLRFAEDVLSTVSEKTGHLLLQQA